MKGVVNDANDGSPLIGASVIEKGTSNGTMTDIDGNFSIEVENNAVLVVSYIGYTPQDVPVNNQTYITVNLQMESTSLDEVIVIGYGAQKKSDKTGAVVALKSDELKIGRLSDPIEAMQGRAAGVLVSKQGGDPNAGFSVNIRGASSFVSGAGPLYVVDGVPGVDPTTIASEDIESINVLKDASSTAIYGAKGSNGVIIITTKNNAAEGKNSDHKVSDVSLSSIVSFDNVAKKLKFLSGDQIKQFAADNNLNVIDNGGNVDWQDEIYRSGLTQSHTLAFSGADKNSYYRASLNYNDITGVLIGSSKQRSIGRLQFSQKAIDNRLTLTALLSGTIEKNEYVNYGGGINPTNIIYQAFRRNPLDPVYNDDGTFFETDKSFQYYNPVAIAEQIENNREAKRLLGNFKVDFEILKGLIASVSASYARDDDEGFYFHPRAAASNLTNGYAKRNYNNHELSLIESTITYTKSFNDKHNLTLLGGHSYQKDLYDGLTAEGKNALSDYLKANNLGSLLDVVPGSISSYKNEFLQASFFGRFQYDFMKKYYLTGTVRRDGSSKFGADHKWGTFPSLSVGWNLDQESFFQNSDVINTLKLRFGFGYSGNSNIPAYVNNVYYVPAGTAINPETGEVVLSFENDNDVSPNPDLRWESNRELNLGVDFGLFNNKISGTVEVYQKTIFDLIYKYELPVPPNKNRYIYANAGEVSNKGIEVTLMGYPVSGKKLNWKTILTFAANRQKTNAIGNETYELDEVKLLYVEGRGLVGGENWTQILKPGVSLGTFYLPEYAGLSDDGKFLFYTAAGGVTRDVTLAERRIVGNAQPDFTIGWINNFDIGKNFDVNLAFRAVVGFDIFNVTNMVFSNPSDLPTLNVLEEALDEFDKGLNSAPIVSSYYLEDGTFLKLDNASIGYNFDIGSKYIKKLRVFVSGSNLFTLTGYKGLDPEISYGGIEFGRDQYDVYPKTRTYSVGLNANF
ncbi:MAG: SusC/RagA family TonB-linked outer membrane protein [Saprospiraceae bacterium]